ncbi:hypothetical protein [Endozoicomonas sp. SCSIO W0465]|uniref:hypothetical protein n=1 Tax=Endozoicomonas sp. SCSIO W0465 TaxID=2918516 RepID=UPI00207650A4|nr:hypothetical protein [Endozoicomonas sp. SCSIO W0465]USE38339.1 hypothetical protein MJO57_09320 [Endozoicomonas sp. SCSIO W0465]
MAFSEHQQLQPEDLLRFITQQQEQIIQLKEQVELLEAEIRRLKKLPTKPDIKPSTKPPDGTSSDTLLKQEVKKPNEKPESGENSPESHWRKNPYPLLPPVFRRDQSGMEPRNLYFQWEIQPASYERIQAVPY